MRKRSSALVSLAAIALVSALLFSAAADARLIVNNLTGFGAVTASEDYPSFTDSWDIAQTGNIQLSNGNLTATQLSDTNYESTRSVNSRNAGKWYFEIKADAWTANNPEMALTGSAGYDKTDRIANTAIDFCYTSNGSSNGEGGAISAGTVATTTVTSGTIVGVAVDFDAGKIWVRDASGWVVGDPSVGASPRWTFTANTALYIGWTVWNQNDAVTLNTGASAFNYSVPAGFAAWNN